MDPIGGANKYLQIAMEEYGLDDYSVALENEAQLDEEFGFIEGIVELATGAATFYADNKEVIDGGIQIAGQVHKATATTKKGRKRSSSGKKRASRAKETMKSTSSPSVKRASKEEFLKGKVDEIKGQLQMALGEMRRQIAVSGVSDTDVQLEVIRNAFAKQYFALGNSKKLQKVVLKKTIANMDRQLMQAFQSKNMKRSSQGLPPLVPSYQQPTIEYKV
jgi:hypothetical protein